MHLVKSDNINYMQFYRKQNKSTKVRGLYVHPAAGAYIHCNRSARTQKSSRGV